MFDCDRDADPHPDPGLQSAAVVDGCQVEAGLAVWQALRVDAHIGARLAEPLSVSDLASTLELSRSHFSRAFKLSFGETPHRYLMRRRVERARHLMLVTDASLDDIAADCGLVDQPHFARLFRRHVGESPGVWRRKRKPG